MSEEPKPICTCTNPVWFHFEDGKVVEDESHPYCVLHPENEHNRPIHPRDKP